MDRPADIDVVPARSGRACPARPCAHPISASVLAASVGLAGLFIFAPAAPAQPLTEEGRAKAPPAPPLQPAPGTMSSVESLADRPVREVRIVGLKTVDPQLVRNQIRTRSGTPLNPETVRGDVARLNRLARFKQIDAKVQPFDDGSVEIVYEFDETAVVRDVQVIGNRQLNDADLGAAVATSVQKDTPIDEYNLGSAKSAIERLYRDKGYYQATVTLDEKELSQSGIVLFRIAEGERTKVTEIRYEGNAAFKAAQIESVVKTTTAGIFETGPVDAEQLDRDVQAIVDFYRDRGYLDARGDKQVTFSPNAREAIVTFIIAEGPLYTLRSVRSELFAADGSRSGKPPVILSNEQVVGLMEIKAGDVYSVQKVQRSIETVLNAYRRMGYADAVVQRFELRDPSQPVVDLLLLMREGDPYKLGMINVKGNDLTQDRVVLRELDIKPDRPVDTTTSRAPGNRQISESEAKLNELNLFEANSVKLTTQPADPSNPGYRDVLIELKETNTGSLSFGAGVSSDAGVVGIVSLRQRNFDVQDTPDSFGELFSGRAFRGAGQEFEITAQPGNDVQTYSISLTEPSLLDTDYSAGVSAFYRARDFDEFNETRIGGRLSFGRKFGERWVGNLTFRYDNVDITDIDGDAPVDLFAVEGQSAVSGVAAKLTRTTVDSRFRPTRGNRISLDIERVGALGGDYDFTRISGEHLVFLPIYESFLGYKTVLSWKTQTAYIPEGNDKAPIFERLYLGGSTFRGFRFRTVSPKGIRNDTKELGSDPIGGSFLFFTGLEVQQPIYQDIISVVAFVDSGTVDTKVSFSKYRVSVGGGVRLYISQLSPVPLAFDFGIPLIKEPGDRRRLFSFSIDLPF